jgi:hypothetical protein
MVHRDTNRIFVSQLVWPVERLARSFRTYVVEPRSYSPADHGSLFQAALDYLLIPRHQLADLHQDSSLARETPLPFDLVTFPEAFISPSTLLSFFELAVDLPPMGCVHVGMRSTSTQHLFELTELRDLLRKLRANKRVVKRDLVPFARWLQTQPLGCRLNLGCMFRRDEIGRIRICLHPKWVRSQFECSGYADGNMHEANFLAFVRLRPRQRSMKSIALQPLLCSDILNLDTDRPHHHPLTILSTGVSCYGANPPDHVDVVSVATCTPQGRPQTMAAGVEIWQWQERFRKAFVASAEEDDHHRHHHAIFVLANFGQIPSDSSEHSGAATIQAGLSGVFLPVALPRGYGFPDSAWMSQYGRPDSQSDDMAWVPGASAVLSPKAHMLVVNPRTIHPSSILTIMGFTIERFPRDFSPWSGSRRHAASTVEFWEASPQPNEIGSSTVEFRQRQ